MLKTETILLINYLHQTKEKDTEKIILSLDESRKKLWYEISVINNFLVEGGLQPIESHAGQLFYQDEETEKWTKLLVEQEFDSYQFPEERIPLLIIHIACSQQPLSAKKLQNYFRLSRSSVLADVKRLRDYIEDYELVLLYDKAEGYIFKGDEMKVRRLLENAISHLQHISYLKKSAHYFEVIWGKSLEINEHYAYILNYSKNNLLSFVESRLEELIYNICFNKIRKNTKPINFSKNDTQQLKDQPAYTLSATLVKDIFNHSNEAEILFWETRLLNVLQGEKYTVDAHYFNKLTAKIILHIQQITGINFSESTTLHKTLYQHLVPAYFRMKFDLYYENPLVDKVKKEYHNLFYLIKKGLEPLEQEIGKCVSESEIAYFTIHFGGYLHLKEKTEESTRLRALAICLNGISSSLVMTAGLREIFPEIDFIEQHSIQEALLMSDNQYDLVFSTISFPSEKKVYITKPLPNSVEKHLLRERVLEDFSLSNRHAPIQVKNVVAIFEKHGKITNREALYQDLRNYIYREVKQSSQEVKTLPELMKPSLIRISKEKLDWKQAIAEAAQPLLEQGYIEETYIDAMIQNVIEIGPYIVLAPKVAVPHARPETGVNKLGISLLKLDQSVDFNVDGEEDEERYVQLVFVLAAIDNKAHLTALMQLSKILEDEDNIDSLIEKNSVEELYESINKLVETKGGNEDD